MDRHRHTHHHSPPPPPQARHGHHNPTPPHPEPHHHQHHHTPTPTPPEPHHHQQPAPAPPNVYPPAPAPAVHHVSHTPPVGTPHHGHPEPHHHHTPTPTPPEPHHHQQPAPPNVYPPAPAPAVHHVSHTPPVGTPHHGPTVRVITKAKTDYSLTIRHGKVILAPNDHSDLHQHWIKDDKYGSRVKDKEGHPSFALINKATGQALKHAKGATHPVQLMPYNANHLDDSILWTESNDLGDSYKTIRMAHNIKLNVDALNGDKEHGGVYDGTEIVLWEWKKGDNQRWKIVPY